jgi:hypothetical protein
MKTEIEVVAAPANAGEQYQFFNNTETGQLWKASVELKVARRATVNDIDGAPTEMAVTVIVSPVDKDGKALREDDKPIIIDAHTHTFTSVEMQEPDFDPTKRILNIVAERIHVGEARLTGVDKLNTLAEDWTKKAKLKVSGKITYDPEAVPVIQPEVVDGVNLNVRATPAPVAFAPDAVEAPPASEPA